MLFIDLNPLIIRYRAKRFKLPLSDDCQLVEYRSKNVILGNYVRAVTFKTYRLLVLEHPQRHYELMNSKELQQHVTADISFFPAASASGHQKLIIWLVSRIS